MCRIIIFVAIFFISYLNPAWSQQKIQDFYLSNYKEGGSQDWEIKGREAIVSDEYVEIEDMEGKYYRDDVTVNIKADKAKLIKEYMDVYLDDNVEVESNQGINLTANSLNWEQSSNKVFTETHVEVTRDKSLKVVAEGLEADTELEKINFKKDVKVDIAEQENSTTITCDGPLELDYKLGKAVFNKNVVVDNPNGKMLASRATVYFDVEKQIIIKIVAEGDVKIIRDDNVTFADQAVYLEENKKMILEGRPRLVIFPHTKMGFFDKKKDNGQ